MTRYALAIDLYDAEAGVDTYGNSVRTRANESRVLANRQRVSLGSYEAGKSVGLTPDAVVQVRSADYAGQTRCVLDGEEHFVEAAADSGEFTRLTLRKRLGNADD